MIFPDPRPLSVNLRVPPYAPLYCLTPMSAPKRKPLPYRGSAASTMVHHGHATTTLCPASAFVPASVARSGWFLWLSKPRTARETERILRHHLAHLGGPKDVTRTSRQLVSKTDQPENRSPQIHVPGYGSAGRADRCLGSTASIHQGPDRTSDERRLLCKVRTLANSF
jgi:hypothetical protein